MKFSYRLRTLLAVVVLCLVLVSATAWADAIYTVTGSASATFTFSGTNLTIVLTNTESPTTKNYSAGSTISDLSFSLTGATITGLTSATGQTCTVTSTGDTGCTTTPP